MNPLWKSYKSKVMKTFNPDAEEEPAEEVNETTEEMTPVQHEEQPNTMSQLAKRMQGVGTKGWKNVTALFNKEDEHQLLEPEPESQPIPDHPLAVKPEEPARPKRNTGFWDAFATKWHQAAAMKQAEAADVVAEADGVKTPHAEGSSQETEDQAGENKVGADEEAQGNRFSRYASLGGANEETPGLKWNFVTSKIAELKSKSVTKTN